MNIGDVLTDYIFKISVRDAEVGVDTSYLRKVLLLVKPKGEVASTITEVSTSAALALLTDNTDGQVLLAKGLASIYVLPTATLDVDTIIDAATQEFYTILVSSDFVAADVWTAGVAIYDFGEFSGVVGMTFISEADAKTFGAIKSSCGFYGITGNKAENMCEAFAALLTDTKWNNQQYISLDKNDGINSVATARAYQDDNVSFAITSPEYQNRLSFFVAGGDAIIAPYVLEEIRQALKSKSFSWISTNRPAYDNTNASLLQNYLQNTVLDVYIANGLIESGTVKIAASGNNFTATGTINVAKPNALWNADVIMYQE